MKFCSPSLPQQPKKKRAAHICSRTIHQHTLQKMQCG